LSPIGAHRMRLRPFSKGRISKKIPPDLAVPQYCEVCVPEPLGVSHHFLKPQNIGAPPPHTIDTVLRKGAWPQTARRQSLYWREDSSIILRAELNYTITPPKTGEFWKLVTSGPIIDIIPCESRDEAHNVWRKGLRAHGLRRGIISLLQAKAYYYKVVNLFCVRFGTCFPLAIKL
jgi:hypothetical protein